MKVDVVPEPLHGLVVVLDVGVLALPLLEIERGTGELSKGASRKFIFGCAAVYGQNNDSVIEGAFVVRGQDFKPAFDVAPDYESYEFEKLDGTKPEDRQFVSDSWGWEKPTTHNGKEYPVADGKVFK
ncbi:Elongation factor 1-gamma 2 [Colletotrichum tanaceti]|nr:Elongation factor 1-gamma 2 [Colletotrichum tanaceti]